MLRGPLRRSPPSPPREGRFRLGNLSILACQFVVVNNFLLASANISLLRSRFSARRSLERSATDWDVDPPLSQPLSWRSAILTERSLGDSDRVCTRSIRPLGPCSTASGHYFRPTTFQAYPTTSWLVNKYFDRHRLFRLSPGRYPWRGKKNCSGGLEQAALA